MNIGEWMYFPNMGAYTIAAASRFNGFKQPKVVYMCRRKFSDTILAEKIESVPHKKSFSFMPTQSILSTQGAENAC